jgi:hypothetical protein
MNQAIFAKPKQESNEKVTFEDWNLNQQIHYWKGFNIWHACCFDPLDESLKDEHLDLAIQKSRNRTTLIFILDFLLLYL